MPERTFSIFTGLQHRRAMRLYRAQESIWLWISLATVLAAIDWARDPSAAAAKSAVGHQLSGPLDDIWIWGMATGGIFIAFGIWFFRIRYEILGHLFLTASVAVNAVAVFREFGVTSTGLVLAAVAVASGARIYFLWQLASGATYESN